MTFHNPIPFAPGLAFLVATSIACVEPLPSHDEHASAAETANLIDAGIRVADAGRSGESWELTTEEWAQAKTLSPLPAPPTDPTNKYADDPRAAALGQRLYFDSRYSGAMPEAGIFEPSRVSCASCHAGPGMDRPRPEVQVGAGNPYTKKRNVLGLVNSSYYRWVNWGGRFSAQWELPLAVAENANIMNSDRLKIAHLLFNHYRRDYEAIFGALPVELGRQDNRFPASAKPKQPGAFDGLWEGMTDVDRNAVNHIYVNYAKSLAAYMRKLVSRTSRFDSFVAGDKAALSSMEQQGLKLFVGKGHCMNCHNGPNFADDKFHLVFDPTLTKSAPDFGRVDDIGPLLASPFNSDGYFSDDRTTGRLFGLAAGDPNTRGQFRTPTLRNVTQTAPYMHSGLAMTLKEAVNLHDPSRAGGKDPLLVRLSFSGAELDAVVAFLDSLTSDPLPTVLVTDSFP